MMQIWQHRRKTEWLRFVIRVLVFWAIEVLGLLFMPWLLRQSRSWARQTYSVYLKDGWRV